MSRAVLILALLALAACGGRDRGPDFRREGAPIASKALFDPAAFSGLWHVVAGFPASFDLDCAGTRFAFGTEGQGMRVEHQCRKPGSGIWEARSALGRISGPGRIEVNLGEDFPTSDLWVLWTDDTYRTAVIGTPSGSAGWVLNRDPVIPADRLTAAREILDFNGYDVTRLVVRQ